ncbi:MULTISPECIES: UDP-N-acetylmuramoyl-tripeptide--D-alanyl-D-alanine ligase [unclassified Meiothermus]|uniref:UDP-N-acetylmuramoyl-tripeptide--D-alanyl-D- alanine ligase n=1 Tax=unclassified Meiothermus TaxID=370471 RepID=UPI00157FBC7A|nr:MULTISPECIES: UDP-N-acetylmuramoyl-tripeptide--D-alanyl-D-alanine ligase [unclassified Meiothermus]
MTPVREVTPEWVAQVTQGTVHPPVRPALDLTWDSRTVRPGSAFIALPGARVHGREFAQAALQAGAAFVLTDQAHPGAVQVVDPARALLELGHALRQEFSGVVVGVGGSSGKTTTKEAIAQGLDWPKPEGNLNNAPGLAQFFFRLDPRSAGAVVELGIDRLGEMGELCYLAQPQLGVLTALGAEHLEGLGTLENVLREESRLLASSHVRLASTQAAELVSLPGLKTYGIEAGDFQATDLELSLDSTRFRFNGRRVHLPYPGFGPLLGALAALAVAELVGVALEPVIERLSRLKLPHGRMERQEKHGLTFLNDAYNANPLSLRAGLEFLRHLPGRKWLVLGEMRELGEESLAYHLEAARLATSVSPDVVFVGKFAAAQAAEAGGVGLETLEEAKAYLKAYVQAGDLVYLKASRSIGLERLLEGWDAQ